MPSVGDLESSGSACRRRSGVLGRAVAGDDLDARMAPQPIGDGRPGSVGQQVDRAAGRSGIDGRDRRAACRRSVLCGWPHRRCPRLAADPRSAAADGARDARSYRSRSASPDGWSGAHRPHPLPQSRSESGPARGGASGVLAAASAAGVAQRRCDGGRHYHGSRSVGRAGAASWADQCSADRPDGVHSGCERQSWSCHRLGNGHAHAAHGRRRQDDRRYG